MNDLELSHILTFLRGYPSCYPLQQPILGVALASRSAPEPTDNWEYVPKKWYELSPLCLCVVPFVWAVPVLLVPLIGLAMTDSNIPGLNSSTQYDISPVVFMDTFCMHTSYVYGLSEWIF